MNPERKFRLMRIELVESDKQFNFVRFSAFDCCIGFEDLHCFSFPFLCSDQLMAPKKDTKEAAAASSKKKETTTTTASVKKSATVPTTSKVVTKERKEKVKSTALKAKQRVAR